MGKRDEDVVDFDDVFFDGLEAVVSEWAYLVMTRDGFKGMFK